MYSNGIGSSTAWSACLTLSNCDRYIYVCRYRMWTVCIQIGLFGVSFGVSEERASMECAQSQAEYICGLIEALANLIRALSGVKRCHKWNLIN